MAEILPEEIRKRKSMHGNANRRHSEGLDRFFPQMYREVVVNSCASIINFLTLYVRKEFCIRPDVGQ